MGMACFPLFSPHFLDLGFFQAVQRLTHTSKCALTKRHAFLQRWGLCSRLLLSEQLQQELVHLGVWYHNIPSALSFGLPIVIAQSPILHQRSSPSLAIQSWCCRIPKATLFGRQQETQVEVAPELPRCYSAPGTLSFGRRTARSYGKASITRPITFFQP